LLPQLWSVEQSEFSEIPPRFGLGGRADGPDFLLISYSLIRVHPLDSIPYVCISLTLAFPDLF